ncbi:rhodopirellula transposase [mine drainage metagenome]|uniref:Rhodopirellula transposase n=1 Tax=mine drainage metagenome TaxID=410659 RepID=A0A1J5Q809_9ZZZZ
MNRYWFMAIHDDIQARFKVLNVHLDEQSRRLWAAAEAMVIGHGGGKIVHAATGISKPVITAGLRELRGEVALPEGRIRRAGAGRKRTADGDPTLVSDLEKLVEPTAMGSPESPLRWTIKSLRTLAEELERMGHKVSHRMVAELLTNLRYSLQGNRKTLEGSHNPDRNEQFMFINERAKAALDQGQPVISVDTKKKELVGNYKNGGKDYRPKGEPVKVKVHDFIDLDLGKVAPYGVYDIARNEGWVNVGVDHDTSAFAVESIRRWWNLMGKPAYPNASRLMITADSGGSNGARVKLWKVELQAFADETGLEIQVSHFPPGTSKWNKIEHRLFSALSLNWRGKPLISHEVIINLIQATQTRTGLKVRAALDKGTYPKGIKVTKAQMAALDIHPENYHGEWNYTLKPRDR